ncbi:MAG: ribosomal protein S18-alanine N-acetyltransferase, partial [Burkholderiaceae bacterium]
GNFLDSLRAGYSLRILKENGVMIGYVVWMAVVEEAHLLNLTLSPARQGHGLGSWMMQQFMAQVQAAGFAKILLEVRPSNQAAIGLYRKFGFKEIGRRHGYYPNSGAPGESREDAIVMRYARTHRQEAMR